MVHGMTEQATRVRDKEGDREGKRKMGKTHIKCGKHVSFIMDDMPKH